MSKLIDLLSWYAERAGIRILEICEHPHEGFESVVLTADESYYGLNQSITGEQAALIAQRGYAEWSNLATKGFPDLYIARSMRLIADMYHRSKVEGFEFYNGTLARLTKASVRSGQSAHRSILDLTICGTSYFTAVATNIHIKGYRYSHLSLPEEPGLQVVNWAMASDWRKELSVSPLANALAIHLFLYNDTEIIYAKRGKVGQASGMWNSPVNGVMEFGQDNPDWLDGKPNLRNTAIRETLYELNLGINPQDVKWIALVGSDLRGEPGVFGVCKTNLTRREIASLALDGREQREISDNPKKKYREKELRAINRKYNVKLKEISFGVGSVSIPYDVTTPSGLRKVIKEKILQRVEKTPFKQDMSWTDGGAVALLFCLAHICNLEELTDTLSSLKAEHMRAYK